MKRPTHTNLVWLTAIFSLIAYDLWAFFNSTPGDTLSRSALLFAQSHFTLPFMAGYLGGHLFWPRRQPLFGWEKKISVPVLLAITAAVAVIDVTGWLDGVYVLPWMMPLGYPFGHWLWPQNPDNPGA